MNDFNFMFLTGNKSNGLLMSSNTENDSESLLSNNYNYAESVFSGLYSNDSIDAFGGKDMFGTVDVSNLNESFFVCEANSDTETMGSVAYNSAETAGSIAFAGAGACVGAGADSGSCGGGGSFASVC